MFEEKNPGFGTAGDQTVPYSGSPDDYIEVTVGNKDLAPSGHSGVSVLGKFITKATEKDIKSLYTRAKRTHCPAHMNEACATSTKCKCVTKDMARAYDRARLFSGDSWIPDTTKVIDHKIGFGWCGGGGFRVNRLGWEHVGMLKARPITGLLTPLNFDATAGVESNQCASGLPVSAQLSKVFTFLGAIGGGALASSISGTLTENIPSLVSCVVQMAPAFGKYYACLKMKQLEGVTQFAKGKFDDVSTKTCADNFLADYPDCQPFGPTLNRIVYSRDWDKFEIW